MPFTHVENGNAAGCAAPTAPLENSRPVIVVPLEAGVCALAIGGRRLR